MTRSARLRTASLVLAVLLAAGALLLVQQRADAAPAGASVTASIAGADSAHAQLAGLIQSIVCPILQAVRNAFADSPFFGFVQPILDALLSLFGCTPSP